MPKLKTLNIEVEVSSKFESERSDPAKNYYFFSYHIKISNIGGAPTRLLSRHWIITDGFGRTHEVKGDGVVGEQPYLSDGQGFEYTSFCPLPTPSGQMKGSYEMKTDDGNIFQAEIPVFVLMDPNTLN